jgi:hypothetical protein
MAQTEGDAPVPDEVADEALSGGEPTSLGDAAGGLDTGAEVLGADRQQLEPPGLAEPPPGEAGEGEIEQAANQAIREIQERREQG